MPTPSPSPPTDSPLNDPRFNRVFTLPADLASNRPKPVTVTYADYGYRNEADPSQEHVLLFFAPLMGSRLLQVTKDALAKKHHIRIISPDRPGFGGTTPAPAKDRLALWREVIPALLSHLQIPHLSCITTHSGGTLYALDLLLHPPFLAFLSPPQTAERPTLLALGAPWVLPSRTGSVPLALAKMLPTALVRQTDGLARVVNGWVGPAVGASAGVLGRLGASFATVSSSSSGASVAAQGGRAGGDVEGEGEGEDEVAAEEKAWPGVMKRVYEEGVEGMSEDAVLLLQKGEGMQGGWGDWGDYDGLLPRVGEGLREAGKRLRVGVFYAEKDMLTGDGGTASKGAKWFDACWGELDGQVVEYRSRTVQGADHDWVWNLKWGAIQEVFASVSAAES